MRSSLFLLCASAALALGTPKAHALGLHGYASCPHGGPGGADGCTGSNTGAAQDPNWAQTAISNAASPSAVNLKALYPQWNRSNIDYPDGYNPATIVAASALSNPGCVYTSTGAGPTSTDPLLACGADAGHAITNGSVNNVDWTNGGTACVYGTFGGFVTGAFTGDNWKFGGCDGGTNDDQHQIRFLFQTGNPLTSVLLSHIGQDGNPPGCTHCVDHPMKDTINSNARQVSFTFDHIVSANNPNRFAELFDDNLSLTHCYVKNFNLGFAASGDHGEFIYTNYDTGSSGWSQNVDYCTALLTPAAPGGGATTVPFYFSNGFDNTITISKVSIAHSYCITNPAADTTTTTGVACFRVSANIFPSVTVKQVYMNADGANWCTLGDGTGAGVTAPVFANVINLYNNVPIAGYDATNNVGTPCAGAHP